MSKINYWIVSADIKNGKQNLVRTSILGKIGKNLLVIIFMVMIAKLNAEILLKRLKLMI